MLSVEFLVAFLVAYIILFILICMYCDRQAEIPERLALIRPSLNNMQL